MSNTGTKGRTHATIFVLWGESFDETAAVFVITGLREAGVRVRVVGLSGPCAKGSHGLGLQADCTLDEALAAVDQAIAVVIPCTMACFQRFWGDPRVQRLVGGSDG